MAEVNNQNQSLTNIVVKKDLSVLTLPSFKQKSTNVPVLQYRKSGIFKHRTFTFDGRYEKPEYNLYEILAAEDGEAYIKRTIQRKRGLADKEGWTLVGNNPRTLEYIKNRLMEISIVSNIPIELLIKDTIGDLIRFHNAFWKKIRNEKASSGRPRRVKTMYGTKILKPVAAYVRIPPETVQVECDPFGNPISYRQMLPNGMFSEEFDAEDIIHFTFNRRAGQIFAAPAFLPVIDDVQMLRSHEEKLQLLTDQYLFPLIIMQIGTDAMPASVFPDGTTEMDIWASKINDMPNNGIVVVSHRHKFEVIETKNILPIEKYLEYFKRRVIAGLGISTMDLGEGEGLNRSTAETTSKILTEDVSDYQKEFAYQFNFEVINELLLEGFMPNVLLEENIVRLRFNEIDTDNKIKIENHAAMLYSMNTIDEDEMRAMLKRQPIKPSQREKLFMSLSQENTQTQSAQSAAKEKDQPSNQHGRKLAPTGRKSSMEVHWQDLKTELINHFSIYGYDFIKIPIKSWIIKLDFGNVDNFIYSKLFDELDSIVDLTIEKVTRGIITEKEFIDTLIKSIKNYIGQFYES